MSNSDDNYEKFDYVVEKQHDEKICFGTSVPRDTNPIGKGLSPFQKMISPEIFPKIGPNYYRIEKRTGALYKIQHKIRSKLGVAPLVNKQQRFKDRITRTPSPGRYDITSPVKVLSERVKNRQKPPPTKRKICTRPISTTPSPATYDIRKIKKCRRTKMMNNFGKPQMIESIQTICVVKPTHTCMKCEKLCEGDYWHTDMTTFLCQPCWSEEKATREIFSEKNLKKFKQAEDIKVTISDGALRGRKEFSTRGISFYAFQQIPYGQPPVGNLRFRDPVPATKWNGILDATKNTKICYQRKDLYNDKDFNSWLNEDCLYLNVYTPKMPSQNLSLPVMVYFYGGGFVNGAASFNYFGPHYLMENEVIVVTLNYRLGPFGFLSTGDTVIPGNYGLKDQVLALKWVQKNIKFFGGDPKKVTIFGQSAGAASVSFQLQSPKSNGLFRAAICESGSNLSPWAYQRDHKSIAYRLAFMIDNKFNTSSSSEELLKFLQKVPAKQLQAASMQFRASYGNEEIVQGFWFTPSIEVEHNDAFITRRMYEAVSRGEMKRVPLLIGICSEEAIARAANIPAFKIVVERYESDVSKLVNKNMHLTDKTKLINAGEQIRKIFTNGLLENNLGAALRYFSDTSFNIGVIHHAKLQSAYSDVYFYQFSYHGAMGGNRPSLPGAYKVGHSEENHYLWAPFNRTTLNHYPKSDVLTSDRLRALFTNFVKYLNPTPQKEKLFENIVWPKVTANNFHYLDINETLSIKTNPKGDTYSKWVELYKNLAVPPYDTF